VGHTVVTILMVEPSCTHNVFGEELMRVWSREFPFSFARDSTPFSAPSRKLDNISFIPDKNTNQGYREIITPPCKI